MNESHEFLHSNPGIQSTKTNIPNMEFSDDTCSSSRQYNPIEEKDGSSGIGQKLRQKHRYATRSPYRKIPPFKIKAHKVSIFSLNQLVAR